MRAFSPFDSLRHRRVTVGFSLSTAMLFAVVPLLAQSHSNLERGLDPEKVYRSVDSVNGSVTDTDSLSHARNLS